MAFVRRSLSAAQKHCPVQRYRSPIPILTTREWNEDDFNVLEDSVVVGRIFKANAAPASSPWMWTLAFGHHEDRSPTHGYAATRENAMAAFAKSWRRE